jgi:ABC-type branched-subunit amino acid transport system ATPase component
MGRILETVDLVKRFGGVVAVNNLKFTLDEGEVRGILGPNGSGKTTFFLLVTGVLSADSGKVIFKGEDITRMRPHQIAKRGLGATFQLVNIFPRMTVRENIAVSVNSTASRPWDFTSTLGTAEAEKVNEILRLMQLDTKVNELASNLAYGDQKLLEMAVALGTDPRLLLLDEPTSGVSPLESLRIAECVRQISKDRTIVIIEHDIDFVLRLAQIVTVFNEGSILAEGPSNRILENEDVRTVYMGEV